MTIVVCPELQDKCKVRVEASLNSGVGESNGLAIGKSGIPLGAMRYTFGGDS